MGLFDWIFRPNEAKKSDQALEQAYTMFRTLTAYQPVFTNWGGAIYESEVVQTASGRQYLPSGVVFSENHPHAS